MFCTKIEKEKSDVTILFQLSINEFRIFNCVDLFYKMERFYRVAWLKKYNSLVNIFKDNDSDTYVYG